MTAKPRAFLFYFKFINRAEITPMAIPIHCFFDRRSLNAKAEIIRVVIKDETDITG